MYYKNSKKKAGHVPKRVIPATATNGLDNVSTTIIQQTDSEVNDKFQPKKELSRKLARVYNELELYKRSQRVYECGDYLEFAISEGKSKLHFAHFCKDRLCPMCAWRRSLKIFNNTMRILDYLAPRDFTYLFLTLTVKNCSADELSETVDNLFDGFRYLYNKNKVFKNAVHGTFRTVEVTRNKRTGLFHPHMHVILAVSKSYFKSKHYIKHEQWCSLWQKAAKLDYLPIVDIRTITGYGKGTIGAVAETSKYAVKGTDYLSCSFEQQVKYVKALLESLTRRRLVAYTGVFKEAYQFLALEDEETGNLINVSDDGEKLLHDMIIKYKWKAGVYVGSVKYVKSED